MQAVKFIRLVKCFVHGGTFRAVPEASGQGAARRQWQALGKRSNTGMALPARSLWAAIWLAICGVALAHQGATLPSLARLASDQPDGRSICRQVRITTLDPRCPTVAGHMLSILPPAA